MKLVCQSEFDPEETVTTPTEIMRKGRNCYRLPCSVGGCYSAARWFLIGPDFDPRLVTFVRTLSKIIF